VLTATVLQFSPAYSQEINPSISNSKSSFEVALSGYVQLDAIIPFAVSPQKDHPDLTLRRARLALKTTFTEWLLLKSEINIDDAGNAQATSLYLEYAAADSYPRVRLGQFKTPNSLDYLTSSRHISTIERSQFTNIFEFDRRVGTAVFSDSESHTWNAGLFAGNIHTDPFSSGMAAATRLTYAPVSTASRVIHLGASARYRKNQRFCEADSLPFDQVETVTEGFGDSCNGMQKSDLFVGIENAILFSKFWVSGEIGVLAGLGTEQAAEERLHGGYIEAGYAFGGTKTYTDGAFGLPSIDRSLMRGGPGAYFFVLRYDNAEISHSGGSKETFTVGLDWWATRNLQMRMNLYRTLKKPDPALDTANTEEASTGLSLRLQAQF
jgi:phosphate-selective porin OprO/OprP